MMHLTSPPPVWAPQNAPGSLALMADSKIRGYRSCFGYLVNCLRIPAVYSKALMVWRIAQRILLELQGRVTWLQLIEPVFMELGALELWELPPTRSIVGAITDRPEIVESCYCVCASYLYVLSIYLMNFLVWNANLVCS